MVELTRTLRFCPTGDPDAPRENASAAWPPPPRRGLGGVVELRVTLAGEPDPATGMLVNVRDVDAAFARRVLPALAARDPPAAFLRAAAGALAADLPVTRVSLHPGPASSLTLDPRAMHRVTLRQRYGFSAAHRLASEALSEEENQRLFGKCNRPSFHGHNYTLEVAASAGVDGLGRSLLPADLDAAVNEQVIDRLDHRNLNLDVEAFRGRNPTVEHIAQTCFGWLEGRLPADAELLEVTVWETDRTACTWSRGGPDATPG